MSKAESQIEQFIQAPNTVEALVVSREEAQAAGRAFTDLCDDELLRYAGSVWQHEFREGFFAAHLDKSSSYEDGSSLKVSVSSRSGRLPEGHIDKQMGVKDDPYEIRVRSWTGKGDGLVIQEAEYVFDEAAGTAKKKLWQPVDDIRRLLNIAQIAEVEAPAGEGDALAEEALFADLANALAGQELEKKMGFDTSTLVGPSEVQQLRTLLEGMELAS